MDLGLFKIKGVICRFSSVARGCQCLVWRVVFVGVVASLDLLFFVSRDHSFCCFYFVRR